MEADLIGNMVLNAPNFVGFLLCVWVLRDANKRLSETNTRLVEAILKRENCEDETPPANPHKTAYP